MKTLIFRYKDDESGLIIFETGIDVENFPYEIINEESLSAISDIEELVWESNGMMEKFKRPDDDKTKRVLTYEVIKIIERGE